MMNTAISDHVSLRKVSKDGLLIFFAQQLDPTANAMAVFRADPQSNVKLTIQAQGTALRLIDHDTDWLFAREWSLPNTPTFIII